MEPRITLPRDLAITRPTLILDRARVQRNITRMIGRAEAGGVRLRPHFKTHQATAIGGWFRAQGVSGIAVSSLEMAAYFAADGWEDITVAFPVNLRERDQINALAREIKLGLLVDSPAAVIALRRDVQHPVRVWIKVDVGYGRAGVRWDAHDAIRTLAEGIHGNLTLAGLLTHSGHSYHANSPDEIRALHTEALSRLAIARDHLAATGRGPIELSLGDTPTCTLAEDFTGIAEIRPGNFVFYDLMQHALGVCSDQDIALGVACPVVGHHPQDRRLVLYGGAVHLSKERLPGAEIYGYLATCTPEGLGSVRTDAPLISLSQEHGIVRVPADIAAEVSLGDLVCVLPVHACLTANLHGSYWVLGGETLTRR